MKKIFALMLALSMLLSLAACGGGSTPAETSEPAPVATREPVEATPEPTAEPAPEPVEEPAEEPDPILGSYDPDSYTYVNEFLGIGFEMDESWAVYDEDAIAELNGMVSEMLTDEELAEALEKSGSAQIFYAEAEDGLVNVNIVVESLGLLYGAVLDEQAYLKIAMDQVGPALESLGMEDVNVESLTMTFAGEDHAALKIYGTMEGYEIYECLVCVKAGQYMASITATSILADLTGTILEDFYGL